MINWGLLDIILESVRSFGRATPHHHHSAGSDPTKTTVNYYHFNRQEK